jgi:tetratricopeptide (TPR) repeat protein
MYSLERHSVSQWRRLGSLGVAFLLLSVSVPALAQADWESNRGNCNDVLSSPENYEIEEIRTCAQRWESYGSTDAISSAEARQFARGFSRLYYEGSRRDQSLSEGALSRLGLAVLPRGDFLPDPALQEFLNRDQSPIRVEEASSRAHRRAQDHNRDGMREYERGNYRAAAEEFRDALDDEPFHIRAKYNLACQYALLGQVDDSVETLDELNRWESGDAREQVTHARNDEDLIELRSDIRFRLITGYANIQLLNGAGDDGLEKVAEIHAALVESGYDIASYGFDQFSRARPIIWHRRGYEELAENVSAIIDSPDVGTRLINFDSEYDLIAVWGAMGGAEIPRPYVQGLVRVDGGDPEEYLEDVMTGAEDAAGAAEDPAGAAQEAAEEWVPSF